MVFTKRFFIEVTSLDDITDEDFIQKLNDCFPRTSVIIYHVSKEPYKRW